MYALNDSMQKLTCLGFAHALRVAEKKLSVVCIPSLWEVTSPDYLGKCVHCFRGFVKSFVHNELKKEVQQYQGTNNICENCVSQAGAFCAAKQPQHVQRTYYLH